MALKGEGTRHSSVTRVHMIVLSWLNFHPLHRSEGGGYQVRVAVRNVDLGAGNMPLLSASLQVGSATFSESLSCSPARGRRVVCHG